jgi:hypothetical protein
MAMTAPTSRLAFLAVTRAALAEDSDYKITE